MRSRRAGIGEADAEQVQEKSHARSSSTRANRSTAGLRRDTMTINMGPQHPSTHGVLRLVLTLDGETILKARPDIGYLHTGIEKTAEPRATSRRWC